MKHKPAWPRIMPTKCSGFVEAGEQQQTERARKGNKERREAQRHDDSNAKDEREKERIEDESIDTRKKVEMVGTQGKIRAGARGAFGSLRE